MADPKVSPLDRVRAALETALLLAGDERDHRGCEDSPACTHGRVKAGLPALDETAARLARLEAVADAARAYLEARHAMETATVDDEISHEAWRACLAAVDAMWEPFSASVRALDAPTGDAAPAPTADSASGKT